MVIVVMKDIDYVAARSARGQFIGDGIVYAGNLLMRPGEQRFAIRSYTQTSGITLHILLAYWSLSALRINSLSSVI